MLIMKKKKFKGENKMLFIIVDTIIMQSHLLNMKVYVYGFLEVLCGYLMWKKISVKVTSIMSFL